MPDPNDLIFAATAFASRAHRNQLRKDEKTPYFSHPVRVCLVVRHIFAFDDPRMLAAALLHDTIEDTTTDYDDIVEQFGPDVARWVAVLSKDSRLQEEEREVEYNRVLASADWQAKAIKLADMFDNLGDCQQFTLSAKRKTAKRVRRYLDTICQGLPSDLAKPAQLVEARLTELERSLTV